MARDGSTHGAGQRIRLVPSGPRGAHRDAQRAVVLAQGKVACSPSSPRSLRATRPASSRAGALRSAAAAGGSARSPALRCARRRGQGAVDGAEGASGGVFEARVSPRWEAHGGSFRHASAETVHGVQAVVRAGVVGIGHAEGVRSGVQAEATPQARTSAPVGWPAGCSRRGARAAARMACSPAASAGGERTERVDAEGRGHVREDGGAAAAAVAGGP
jgi:hypothetical protein